MRSSLLLLLLLLKMMKINPKTESNGVVVGQPKEKMKLKRTTTTTEHRVKSSSCQFVCVGVKSYCEREMYRKTFLYWNDYASFIFGHNWIFCMIFKITTLRIRNNKEKQSMKIPMNISSTSNTAKSLSRIKTLMGE